MTDLSSRLSSVRKKCSPSPSQAEVAKALNIAQSTYARFESGTREPPLSFIVNFCLHFNVSADYILGLSDVKKPAPPISIAPAIMPLDPFAGLSPANRESANKYVEFLLTQQEEIERIAHAKDKEA